MTNTILFGVVVIPAIVGLTEVAKDVGLPSRFAPLIAVLFGALAGLAQLYATSQPWVQAVVVGLSMGLSAVGLYSGAQQFTKGASPPQTSAPIVPICYSNAPANCPNNHGGDRRAAGHEVHHHRHRGRRHAPRRQPLLPPLYTPTLGALPMKLAAYLLITTIILPLIVMTASSTSAARSSEPRAMSYEGSGLTAQSSHLIYEDHGYRVVDDNTSPWDIRVFWYAREDPTPHEFTPKRNSFLWQLTTELALRLRDIRYIATDRCDRLPTAPCN